jgi:hypothetical protein
VVPEAAGLSCIFCLEVVAGVDVGGDEKCYIRGVFDLVERFEDFEGISENRVLNIFKKLLLEETRDLLPP